MSVSLAELIEFTGTSVAVDRGTVAVARPVIGGVEVHFAGITGAEAFVIAEGSVYDLIAQWGDVADLLPADLDELDEAVVEHVGLDGSRVRELVAMPILATA